MKLPYLRPSGTRALLACVADFWHNRQKWDRMTVLIGEAPADARFAEKGPETSGRNDAPPERPGSSGSPRCLFGRFATECAAPAGEITAAADGWAAHDSPRT